LQLIFGPSLLLPFEKVNTEFKIGKLFGVENSKNELTIKNA